MLSRAVQTRIGFPTHLSLLSHFQIVEDYEIMKSKPLSLNQALKQVGSAIRASEVPNHEQLVTELLGHFAIEAKRDERPSGIRKLVERGIPDRKVYYAIHNEDLDLLSRSVEALTGLPEVLNSPLPVLGSLVMLLYKYRKNRVKLDARQAMILYALKEAKAEGLKLKTLVTNVRRLLTARTKSSLIVNSATVRADLATLQSFRLDNGTKTRFVDQNKGCWYAIDV